MPKVNVLDLTVQQVEDIETELGISVSKWSDATSTAQLYSLILAAATGKDVAVYKVMTFRELIALVSIDEEESDPNS